MGQGGPGESCVCVCVDMQLHVYVFIGKVNAEGRNSHILSKISG